MFAELELIHRPVPWAPIKPGVMCSAIDFIAFTSSPFKDGQPPINTMSEIGYIYPNDVFFITAMDIASSYEDKSRSKYEYEAKMAGYSAKKRWDYDKRLWDYTCLFQGRVVHVTGSQSNLFHLFETVDP